MNRSNRAKRRSRRRAGKRWLLAIPVVALAVWLVLVNQVFVIRGVDIVGEGSVPEQEVMRMSGIHLGVRMNTLDETAVQAGVESDGRLAFVNLDKRYPHTVILTVRERTRDAMILQAGKVVVLDSDGYVIAVEDRLPSDSMTYVTGLKPSSYQLGKRLDAAESKLNAMKVVLEAIRARGAGMYVSELSVENTSDLRITSRTGIVVLLGDTSGMNDKITWMVGALRDLESRGQVSGQLDVSSASKADFLPGPTPTPAPTPSPTPETEEYVEEQESNTITFDQFVAGGEN